MLGKRSRARLQRSHDVVAVGRDPGADFRLDLQDTTAPLPEIGNADVVIHCAAGFAGNSIAEMRPMK